MTNNDNAASGLPDDFGPPPLELKGIFATLRREIQDAIMDSGYTQPTPIQEQAIPHLLEGKDLIGSAQREPERRLHSRCRFSNCLPKRKPARIVALRAL